MVLNSLFLSLAISLFPLITAELNLSWQAGMWAGLAACWPSSLGEVQTVFGEPLTVLLVTFAFYLALRSRPLAAVAASGILAQGLLLGFITLLNPVASLGVAALLPLSYLLAPDKHTRSHLLRSAAVLGIATLMVAPWTLRNYARLGGLVVVRSNFGLELQLAHNQFTALTLAGHEAPHPNTDPAEAERVRAVGEIAYNREKSRAAINWILRHPLSTALVTVKRAIRYWLPVIPDGRRFQYFCWLLTVTGWAGLALLYVRRRTAFWWLATITALNFAVYVWFSSAFRYRFPSYWTTQISSGYCAFVLFGRVQAYLRRW